MPSTSLTGDPHTWPFSRPSLAAHGRESGLPLVNHLRNIGSPPKLPRQFENQGLLPFTICDPLSVPSLRMEDGSMVTFLSYYVLSLLLSSSTSESDGLLSSPQRVLRCGILCSPSVPPGSRLSRFKPPWAGRPRFPVTTLQWFPGFFFATTPQWFPETYSSWLYLDTTR